MIHSARPIVTPVANIVFWFFSVTLGWPRGSTIQCSFTKFDPKISSIETQQCNLVIVWLFTGNKSKVQLKSMTYALKCLNKHKIGKKLSPSFTIDPLDQPKVTAGRYHCFRTCCPSVRPSTLFKSRKNKTTENNVRYWRDYGSGRVDQKLGIVERNLLT